MICLLVASAAATRGLLTSELLDRFIVVPERKLLFCQIESNACTVFNELFLRLRHQENPPAPGTDVWGRNTPRQLNLTKTDLERILRDKEWHKAVFYREPSERFIAAYDSKCLPGRDTDRIHCRRAFGDRLGVPFDTAVCKLAERNEMNDVHFMHQHRFCGGLSRTLEYYDTVERLDDNVRVKVHALLGSLGVDADSLSYFDTLFPPSNRTVETVARKHHHALHARHLMSKYLTNNDDAVDIIVRHFAPDYNLFRMPTPTVDNIPQLQVANNDSKSQPLNCLSPQQRSRLAS